MKHTDFTVRYNNMKITSLNAFGAIKGGLNQGCKDVYFVRGLGVTERYAEDILSMDDLFVGNQSGLLGYQRQKELKRLARPEDITFYTKAYEAWQSSKRQRISLKNLEQGKGLESVIAQALTRICKKFQDLDTNTSETIVKNFAIKQLFWLDDAVPGFLEQWEERGCYKYIYCGSVKRQEYLFCYLLTQLGVDVLMLTPQGEPQLNKALLDLSFRLDLGPVGQAEIPRWEKGRITAQQSLPMNSAEQEGNSCRISLSEVMRARAERKGAAAKSSRLQSQENHSPSGAPSSAAAAAGTPSAATAAGTPSSAAAGIPPAATAAGAPRVKIPPRKSRNMPVAEAKAPTAAMQAVSASQGKAPSAAAAPAQVTVPARPVNARKAPSASSDSSRQEKSFEDLARMASSVVMIEIRDEKGEPAGTGSGIMVSEGGYILTNFHVASGAGTYLVRIEDEKELYQTDELIKYNQVMDLALIRILRHLKPIPIFGGDRELARGQKVVAIGSPLGLFNSVSDGIISGFRKIRDIEMIQFTAPISHGSSGGALLNMYGELIGISTAGFDQGQNINLAVDYRDIRQFLRGFI